MNGVQIWTIGSCFVYYITQYLCTVCIGSISIWSKSGAENVFWVVGQILSSHPCHAKFHTWMRPFTCQSPDTSGHWGQLGLKWIRSVLACIIIQNMMKPISCIHPQHICLEGPWFIDQPITEAAQKTHLVLALWGQSLNEWIIPPTEGCQPWNRAERGWSNLGSSEPAPLQLHNGHFRMLQQFNYQPPSILSPDCSGGTVMPLSPPLCLPQITEIIKSCLSLY